PSSAIFASGPKSFIPGFGRPIALSKPTSSSRIVGFVFPARGFGPIDFVTTAPAPAWNTRRSVPPVSSRKPDASIVGFRSFNPARVVATLGIIEGRAGASLSLPRKAAPIHRREPVTGFGHPRTNLYGGSPHRTAVRIADLGLDPRI